MQLANFSEEPIINTKLKACGNIGANDGEELWAIDQYDGDGINIYQSFLYSSEFEYDHDCRIMGLTE